MNQTDTNMDAFVVKHSKGLSLFAGLTSLFLLFVSLDRVDAKISANIPPVIYITLGLGFVILVLSNERIVIQIDDTGITYMGELVTDWANFISADYKQDEINGSFRDNFVLLVEYYKPDTGSVFVSKIPLTYLQNKSEEAVLEAVRRFYTAYTNQFKQSA
jgi:hypothetical protein